MANKAADVVLAEIPDGMDKVVGAIKKENKDMPGFFKIVSSNNTKKQKEQKIPNNYVPSENQILYNGNAKRKYLTDVLKSRSKS